MVEGIEIGPNGPISKHGKTIGGKVISAAMFGSKSTTIGGISGILSITTVKSCGNTCTNVSLANVLETSLLTV